MVRMGGGSNAGFWNLGRSRLTEDEIKGWPIVKERVPAETLTPEASIPPSPPAP